MARKTDNSPARGFGAQRSAPPLSPKTAFARNAGQRSRGLLSCNAPRSFLEHNAFRGDCFHATKSNTRGASGCNASPPAFFDVQREAYGRTTRKNAPGFHKKQRVARKAGQRSRGLLSRNAPRSILERKAPPREYRPQGPPGPRPGISGPLQVSRPGSRAKKNASRNSPKGKLRKA